MFLSSGGRKGSGATTWANDWLLDLAKTRGSLSPQGTVDYTGSLKGTVKDESQNGKVDVPSSDSETGASKSSAKRLPGKGSTGNSNTWNPWYTNRGGRASPVGSDGSWSGMGDGDSSDSSQDFADESKADQRKGGSSSNMKGIDNNTSKRGQKGKRGQGHGGRGRIPDSSEALRKAQVELEELRRQLKDEESMVDHLASTNEDLETQRQLLMSQIDDIKQTKDLEIESLREQLDQAHFKLRKAERRNRYVDDSDRWKADAKYRKKQQDTTSLLFGFPSYDADEPRREEILKERRGAQGLVAKSVNVVTAMMSRFNEELFQTAASCSDLVENMGFAKASMSSVTRDRADRVLGTRLVSMILPTIPKTKGGTHINPLVVQVVIQTFLAYWCNSIIEAWYPKQATFAEFLVDVSSKLKVGANPNICGKKTVITQKHTRESNHLFGEWVDDMLDDLTGVLSLFGWSVELPSSTSHSTFFSPPSVHEPFLALVKDAYDIRTAMAEISTSGDVDLVIVSCDTPFNELWMQDAYGDARTRAMKGIDRNPYGKTTIECVVATTGIGLQREVLKAHTPSGVVSREIEMVLKPRVVLEYTMLDAFVSS
ncbi:hypothetical protein D9611_005008 [Ephemerocybe angulata]|uniref:Uncharacterized protein n=1 Tax=Ephemerocybe angulata TaxID=980116 RepID=A0A8H5B343_9AGAR|nr:hypothetical protein D9611_005008 [Tulosesus angulatus]